MLLNEPGRHIRPRGKSWLARTFKQLKAALHIGGYAVRPESPKRAAVKPEAQAVAVKELVDEWGDRLRFQRAARVLMTYTIEDDARVSKMTGDELEREAMLPPIALRAPPPPAGDGLVHHFTRPSSWGAERRYRALYGKRPGKGYHRGPAWLRSSP